MGHIARPDMHTPTLINGDCLDVMATLPAGCVDLVLCDLPYGTTENKWDSVIPLDALWSNYWRVAKPHAAVVLTAAQPFTSALVMSQPDAYKHEWVWEKEPSGNLNAKRMPMPAHESVLVFCRQSAPYNPQGLRPTLRKRGPNDNSHTPNYRDLGGRQNQAYLQTVTGYPSTLLPFAKDRDRLHPTQKPVALMEYLVRTYTNPGDVVLDNCMGSGTTGVACANTDRRFIGIERDPTYFAIASARILKPLFASRHAALARLAA